MSEFEHFEAEQSKHYGRKVAVAAHELCFTTQQVCKFGKALAPPRALRHQAPIKMGRRASLLGERGIIDRGFLSRGLMCYVT